METCWFLTLFCTLCVSFFLKPLFTFIFSGNSKKLPPGPFLPSLIGYIPWRRRPIRLELILRDLRSKYGPIFTLRVGSVPSIFISGHSLAHQALIQNGSVFSDRPIPPPVTRLLNSNHRNISSAAYGPTWRLLRRNLTSEILHPSRVRSYSKARRWVLADLCKNLLNQNPDSGVKVIDHFRHSMFSLLSMMCFGDKLDETLINQIEATQRRVILSFRRFYLLNFWPTIGRIFFRNLWKEAIQVALDREITLIPLIKARIEPKEQGIDEEDKDRVLAYVDTLKNLELPDEKRKLNYGEMATLCGEFLNAGTDTTSTALEWIMANLVKNPSIQAKLYEEIAGVLGTSPKEDEFVKEENLQEMPYLKAVILEGLRRHPPGHFVLPHSVTEEVEFEGYFLPKNAVINFMVADMGWDPKVWEDPMEFKPERFLPEGGGGEAFDISGTRGVKMMPFGVGRRICPGLALAMLHLEYFVANLVWFFEWKCINGCGVDLTEKQEFTTVMKTPLRARLYPRNNNR
ncbi:unnamed protein product [Cuscuta campestris]|uniref:Cytochrome P450 n=1 Tax=Cuscuta campestris TaxID=132261 RepID=A0A484LV28_9ASTE|nr:unnamed protein product [Cuscuta campestris]